MTIDTAQVITLGSEPARRHASNVLQSGELIFGGLVRVVMAAVGAVGAIVPEIVHITHVDFFDPVDFVLVVVQN